MALGLGILVAVSAHAGPTSTAPPRSPSTSDAALTGGTVLLALALVVTVALILSRRRPSPVGQVPDPVRSA